jgi:hypothetical protein
LGRAEEENRFLNEFRVQKITKTEGKVKATISPPHIGLNEGRKLDFQVGFYYHY